MNVRAARWTGAGLAASAVVAATLLAAPGVAQAATKEECDKLLNSAVSDLKSAGEINQSLVEMTGAGPVKNASKYLDNIRFLTDRAGHAIDSYNEAGCGSR